MQYVNLKSQEYFSLNKTFNLVLDGLDRNRELFF